MNPEINPHHIMQIGMGFMGCKTLLSAVELELFTVVGKQSMSAARIGDRLGLHPRSLHDFLDALVSLNLLDRVGDGPDAEYRNTPEGLTFLDKNSRAYIGGILEMANSRLYGFWGELTTALKTGEPQNETKTMPKGSSPFEVIYANENRLEQFLRAMQGVQMGAFMALAEKVDFSGHQTFLDVGGANGTLSAVVAGKHGHLRCTSFDMPAVKPIAERHLRAMGVNERVEAVAGDFFTDELPSADVVCMGNILHDWDETQKKQLVAKAYAATNEGGKFIAIENVIDDARRENTFGLLMSLNMLIELPGGFDYTGAQFDAWCKEAGFARTEVIPLAGPTSAAIAYR